MDYKEYEVYEQKMIAKEENREDMESEDYPFTVEDVEKERVGDGEYVVGEDAERRQRSNEFFGDAYEYHRYKEDKENEAERNAWMEDYDPSDDWRYDVAPPSEEDYGVWDDSGIRETYDQYLRRVTYSYYEDVATFGNDELYNTLTKEEMQRYKEDFLKSYAMEQNTEEMNRNEKRTYKKLRGLKIQLLQYHTLKKLIEELSADELFAQLEKSWYEELVNKADKEAYNRAYLQGYKDGHRDGYRDCVRNKGEDNYPLPNVEASKYPIQKDMRDYSDETPF